MEASHMRNPWAREYGRTPERYIWGKVPSEFAKDLVGLLPPGGRVLDLGCGEGRDSVFFASRGFEVTGLDVSAAGIAKGRRLAAECRADVHWLAQSMLDVPVAGRFDLIYSYGSIHHVSLRNRDRLFRRLKVLTNPGGVHAHLVFTDAAIYREKSETIDYFKSGELADLYGDWSLVRRERGEIPCAQDGTRHSHSMEQIVAVRPFSA